MKRRLTPRVMRTIEGLCAIVANAAEVGIENPRLHDAIARLAFDYAPRMAEHIRRDRPMKVKP